MMESLERTIAVLYDQSYLLQQLKRFVEANAALFSSVRDALERGGEEYCNLFLSFRELQAMRESLLRFEDYPEELHSTCLHALCIVESLVFHVYLNDEGKRSSGWFGHVCARVGNVQDMDALLSERLLFDFCWRRAREAATDLGAVFAFLCAIGVADRCLPAGVAHAAIPCSVCRFRQAFADDGRIASLTCDHYCSPIRLSSFPFSSSPFSFAGRPLEGEEKEEEEEEEEEAEHDQQNQQRTEGLEGDSATALASGASSRSLTVSKLVSDADHVLKRVERELAEDAAEGQERTDGVGLGLDEKSRFPSTDGMFDGVVSREEFRCRLRERGEERGKTANGRETLIAVSSGSGGSVHDGLHPVDALAVARKRRDCIREKEKFQEVVRGLKNIARKRRSSRAARGIALDLFARLAKLLERLASREAAVDHLRRGQRRGRRRRPRSGRRRRRSSGETSSSSSSSSDLSSVSISTICNDGLSVSPQLLQRLRRNMESMVVQREDCQRFAETFDRFALGPLCSSRTQVHRRYVDMRKSMFAVGIPPSDIREFDKRIDDVDNKSVFSFSQCTPFDRLFKAVFVASLFRVYLQDIGVNGEFVPRLTRADEYEEEEEEEEEEENNEETGKWQRKTNRIRSISPCIMAFGVGGESVLAAFGKHVAEANTEDVLSLCVKWIFWLLGDKKAGRATYSLQHLVDPDEGDEEDDNDTNGCGS